MLSIPMSLVALIENYLKIKQEQFCENIGIAICTLCVAFICLVSTVHYVRL